MQNIEKKADFLITLVGTSAMPNLIGIVARINLCGRVFLIHTAETEDISDSLKEFIKKKNENDTEGKLQVKSNSIELENYDNPEEVYKNLVQKFKNIYAKIKNSGVGNPVVELNYTGGTKVISSLSCAIFKKVFKDFEGNLYLTYLDGEKSEIYIFEPKLNKESIVNYLSEVGTIPLTALDIVNVHMKSDFDNKEAVKDDFKQSKFSRDIYEYISKNIDEKDKIISYLDKLNNGLSKKSVKESANKVTNFLDEFSTKNKLLNGYNNSDDFFKSFYTERSKLSNKNIKPVVSEKLCGTWFEEVIHQILIELKEENIVDDFVNNLSKERNGATTFEVDFIAVKDYKLYYISVSTVNTAEFANFKLYEAKQRAEVISDSESAVAAITFVEAKNEILKEYMNIWQEKPKNVLITTWRELPKLKEIIRNWIIKKGDVD